MTEGSQYLQGPGAWGRNTAASAVTYTSVPQRISSPPPVAKTTSWQPKPSSAAMGGGGGNDSYCTFLREGRGPAEPMMLGCAPNSTLPRCARLPRPPKPG